jgi:hypothetical protein
MDADDPEQRIAELLRELAEAKAAARPDSGDDRADRYAQALLEGLRTGKSSATGPPGADMAQLREALLRAAADAGMSEAQIDDALQHGTVTVRKGHSVIYQGQGRPQDFDPAPRDKRSGATRVAAIVGRVGALLGVCVGAGAVLTTYFSSSALWMSTFVCRSPYQLAHSTSRFSYKPGQAGKIGGFRCVGASGSYAVNQWAVMGLQSLAAALVVCAVAGAVLLIRRGLRSPS